MNHNKPTTPQQTLALDLIAAICQAPADSPLFSVPEITTTVTAALVILRNNLQKKEPSHV